MVVCSPLSWPPSWLRSGHLSPPLRGYSYYGQPVVKYGRLKRFYDANLQKLRRMHPAVALIEDPQVIEAPAEPCNDDSLECMLAKVSEGL